MIMTQRKKQTKKIPYTYGIVYQARLIEPGTRKKKINITHTCISIFSQKNKGKKKLFFPIDSI